MILYELQGGVTTGFSRETSKVGRVLAVPAQKQHSRAYLARFGVGAKLLRLLSRDQVALDRVDTAQSGGRWSHLSPLSSSARSVPRPPQPCCPLLPVLPVPLSAAASALRPRYEGLPA